MPEKITLKSHVLIALVSGYFTLILNWSFFSKIYAYLFSLEQIHRVFAFVLPVFLFCFLYILFSLLVIKGLTKLILIPMVIISAMVSYASIYYGMVIDYGMIENVVQTDMAESRTYINLYSIAYVSCLGLIPAWAIFKINIQYDRFLREIMFRSLFAGLACVVLAGITLGFYQDFASVGRNNQSVQKLIVPNQWLYSAVKYVHKTYFHKTTPFQQLGDDAERLVSGGKPQLFVLVLGETARAQNYHFDGYARQTNPYTEARDFVSLGDIESCGTATAHSVPCMFSFLTRRNFDSNLAQNQSNLLEVLKKSGMDVRWIDNNSGCKGVCDKHGYVRISTDRSDPDCDGEFCFDQVLLRELDKILAKPLQQDTVLVLHLIGSHGPTYYRRYPSDFRKFLPDCERSDIQNCSREEIVNTYDNTILYTDYVLAQIADLLDKHSEQLDTGMLYMSDHGESLGEDGLYLHGMPWSLAPVEQKTVPGLIWLSKSYSRDHQISMDCLAHLSRQAQLTQDFYVHSVLGLTGVGTSLYEPSLDFTAPCHESLSGSKNQWAAEPLSTPAS